VQKIRTLVSIISASVCFKGDGERHITGKTVLRREGTRGNPESGVA